MEHTWIFFGIQLALSFLHENPHSLSIVFGIPGVDSIEILIGLGSGIQNQFIQKSLILNPWGRDWKSIKILYKPTQPGLVWITAPWSPQILRPRLAAASALRTGAGDADAAGVAAPGDTKVSDAMGYQGETTMPGSQIWKDKKKSAEKKKVAFCQKGWQVLFVSQNVFLVLFFLVLLWSMRLKRNFLGDFSSKTRRLRLGGMNNLEELATHGISLKWLRVPKSQKRQTCFVLVEMIYNDFKERSEKQKMLWMYDVFIFT